MGPLTFSVLAMAGHAVGLLLLHFLCQVSFLNGMFYLPHHTMRWWSIPEMLHLLLRSFPELAGSGSHISGLCFSCFSLESVAFSHTRCLLSWGCFVRVSKSFTNGHNSSRCRLINHDTPCWPLPGLNGPPRPN